MSHLQGTVRGLVASGVLGATFLSAAPGNATTYVVTDGMSDTGVPGCGFVEAIGAINAGKGQNGCAAPTGNDVIQLQQDSGIENSTENNGPYVRTSQITVSRSVTIVGKGMDLTTIRVANGLRVSPAVTGVTVTLENVAIKKHSQQVASMSGLIVNGSSTRTLVVTLNGVKVTEFASANTAAINVTSPTVQNDMIWTTLAANDSLVTLNAGAGIKAVGNGAAVQLLRTTLFDNDNRGLHLENARTQVDFSTVEGNSTSGHGGGIYQISPTLSQDPKEQSNVSVFDSTIANNVANGGDGGGIYFAGRNGMEIQRCTISGNHSGSATSGRGGGIFSERPSPSPSYLKMFQSTVAFNRARTQGGGIWTNDGGNGTPIIGTSIVAKNALGTSGSPNWSPSPNGTDIFYPSEPQNGIYPFFSLYGTRQGTKFFCYDLAYEDCDPSLVPATPTEMIDPLLVATLTSAGGPTKVHRFQPVQPPSPALDFVDCSIMQSTTDQRGFAVGVDYNFDQASFACDIGPYEAGGYEVLQAAPPADFTSFRPAAMTYVEAGTGLKFLDVFITGPDGDIYQKYTEILPSGALAQDQDGTPIWTPDTEYEYFTDGMTAYSPAVVPLANNEAYLFVNSGDSLWAQKRLADYELGAWESLGGPAASAPFAVNANDQETWVFVRGMDDNLRYVKKTGSGAWGGLQTVPIGPLFQGDPTAAYLSGPNRVYVFARKWNGAVAYRYYNRNSPPGWSSAWTDIPGSIAWDATAAARTATEIDLYAMDGSGRLLVGTLNSTGTFTAWSTRPSSTAGGMTTPPGASSRRNGTTVDVFMVRPEGFVERQETPW